jgi:hypothetical protein
MNPIDLMAQLIRENAPPDIWANSPLEAYRRLGMTNRGEIGEQFIERYLNRFGIRVMNGNRADETDRRIGTMLLEIKTAGLGAKGNFQFNHVRLDRNYHHLICLGVCPNQLVFNMWPEDVVRANGAGRLVTMARDQLVTYKLTKRFDDMRPIADLVAQVRQAVADHEG